MRRVASPLDEAVAAGLGYLSQAVREDGAWPANVFEPAAPLAGYAVHFPPFVAGLGVLSLAASNHPAAASLVQRSRAYLRDVMIPGQLWRYARFVHPDTDDTAICSMATGPHAQALANIETVLSRRDSAGRFLTWIPAPQEQVTLFNEPDAVVNANIIAYLGDRMETHAAQQWLRTLIVEAPDRIDAALHYYPYALDLDIAAARGCDLQAPILAELRQPILDRIRAAQAANGTFVDIMRTAQALTALDRLRSNAPEPVVRAAVQVLLDAQQPDGSWPECVAWIGGPGQPFAFESATLTTACCIEALQRMARR